MLDCVSDNRAARYDAAFIDIPSKLHRFFLDFLNNKKLTGNT